MSCTPALVARRACVLSAGWSISAISCTCCASRDARRARRRRGDCLLLFGKNAPQGRVDPDFAARLDRAAALWPRPAPARLRAAGRRRAGRTHRGRGRASRAARARARAGHAAASWRQRRATPSRTCAMRARLLGDAVRGRVTLLYSRYHLARCALFARQLGFDAELCAAETSLRLAPAHPAAPRRRSRLRLLGRHRHPLGTPDRPPADARAGDLRAASSRAAAVRSRGA